MHSFVNIRRLAIHTTSSVLELTLSYRTILHQSPFCHIDVLYPRLFSTHMQPAVIIEVFRTHTTENTSILNRIYLIFFVLHTLSLLLQQFSPFWFFFHYNQCLKHFFCLSTFFMVTQLARFFYRFFFYPITREKLQYFHPNWVIFLQVFCPISGQYSEFTQILLRILYAWVRTYAQAYL